MPRTDDAGATLIELTIVVAIIAILATLSVPHLLAARAGTKEAVALAKKRAEATDDIGRELYVWPVD